MYVRRLNKHKPLIYCKRNDLIFNSFSTNNGIYQQNRTFEWKRLLNIGKILLRPITSQSLLHWYAETFPSQRLQANLSVICNCIYKTQCCHSGELSLGSVFGLGIK